MDEIAGRDEQVLYETKMKFYEIIQMKVDCNFSLVILDLLIWTLNC